MSVSPNGESHSSGGTEHNQIFGSVVWGKLSSIKNHCRVKAKETAKVNFKKVKMISYSLFENPFQNV